MTDLHTHILPGMDDGAKTPKDSLTMLRMECSQGVDTVVLTPHFYRDRENPKRFLHRRKESARALANYLLDEITEEEQDKLPRMLLGAEVAWMPNLADWDELGELCIGDTKNLLLELPFTPWNDKMIHQLYELFGRTGITPVIAHLERYLKLQKPEYIQEVLGLGVPVQISADILLHPLARGSAMKMLRQGQGHFVATDCHNTTTRAPKLAEAMGVLRKKLGDPCVEKLIRCGDELAIG